jgi:histidine triad (HIT) family protein
MLDERAARQGVDMSDEKPDFWHGQGQCWACLAIAGTDVAAVVAETPAVVVVVNPFALNPGHTLVISRQHIRNLYELPDDLAGPILSTAARVARAAKRAFSADGITLRQNNDAASDQHLFHFHLHVIPRFIGDDHRFTAPPQQSAGAEQEALAAQLRIALASEERPRPLGRIST